MFFDQDKILLLPTEKNEIAPAKKCTKFQN